MPRRHGIVGADTLKRIVIDSGEVRLNYVDETTRGTLIGATRGGSTFTIEQEFKDFGVDGSKGAVKGAKRITKLGAKLVANFIEVNDDLIRLALPGSTSTSHPVVTPTHYEITRSLKIATSDYNTSVAIIGEVTGSLKPIVIILKNVLVDGNFEIGFTDNDESVIPLQFTAHFDPAAMDTEPWVIRYPEDIATTTIA